MTKIIQDKRLEKSYSYSNTIIDNFEKFKDDVISKEIIPYQVEFQPPPSSLKKICWLECAYCYGASADDSKSSFFEIFSVSIESNPFSFDTFSTPSFD